VESPEEPGITTLQTEPGSENNTNGAGQTPKEPEKEEQEEKKEVLILQNYNKTGIVKNHIKGDSTIDQNIVTNNIFNLSDENRRKLQFSKIACCEYHETLSEGARRFISEAKDQQIAAIRSSGTLVIGYESGSRDIAVAAMESIVFDDYPNDENRAFSCIIDNNAGITLHSIVEEALNDENFKPETGQFLVIYDETEPEAQSSNVLRSILAKGSSDNITAKLRSNNLSVIYLCRNKDAFRKESGRTSKLFDVTQLQMFIYDLTGEYKTAVRYYNQICEAIVEFNWLKGLSETEVKKHISDIVQKGELEAEIERIKKQENEQNKMITTLLEDPLKRAVLLVACYFGSVTVKEFLEIVNLLIQNHTYAGQEENEKKQSLQNRWNAEADKIINDCWITVESAYTARGRTYAFASRFRKKSALEVLERRPNMLLQAAEILQSIWLDHTSSEQKAEGFKSLCFTSAVYDEHRYLNAVFLSLADSLRANDAKLKDKFMRLKNFLDEWELNEEFRDTLEKCFEEMKQTRPRRKIYSAILTYNCRPGYPQYIERLKSLLKSVSNQELVSIFEMIEQVVLNHIDSLDMFFQSAREWNADENESQARAPENYIRYAVLFAFNANTDERPNKREFGYHILKKITEADSHVTLSELMIFLFNDKGKTDFINILKTDNNNIVETNLTKDLHLVFAFVFVKWLEILDLIRQETSEHELDARDLILQAVKDAQNDIPVSLIRKAVINLKILYNDLIIQQPRNTPEEKQYREILISKRNYANDVLDIISEITTK